MNDPAVDCAERHGHDSAKEEYGMLNSDFYDVFFEPKPDPCPNYGLCGAICACEDGDKRYWGSPICMYDEQGQEVEDGINLCEFVEGFLHRYQAARAADMPGAS